MRPNASRFPAADESPTTPGQTQTSGSLAGICLIDFWSRLVQFPHKAGLRKIEAVLSQKILMVPIRNNTSHVTRSWSSLRSGYVARTNSGRAKCAAERRLQPPRARGSSGLALSVLNRNACETKSFCGGKRCLSFAVCLNLSCSGVSCCCWLRSRWFLSPTNRSPATRPVRCPASRRRFFRCH